jgi:hypothetical protein
MKPGMRAQVAPPLEGAWFTSGVSQVPGCVMRAAG